MNQDLLGVQPGPGAGYRSAWLHGAVMIATSMAGRGVDIKLGGELAEEITTDVVRVLTRAGFEDPFELSLVEQEKLILCCYCGCSYCWDCRWVVSFFHFSQ